MDFNRLLENFGLPVVALALLAYYAVRGARVVWADGFIPFRDRGLSRVEAFFVKLDATLDATLARHVETRNQNERHEDLSWRIYEEIEGVRDRCDRIIERMGMAAQEPSPRRRRRRPGRPTPEGQDAGASTASQPTDSSQSTSS